MSEDKVTEALIQEGHQPPAEMRPGGITITHAIFCELEFHITNGRSEIGYRRAILDEVGNYPQPIEDTIGKFANHSFDPNWKAPIPRDPRRSDMSLNAGDANDNSGIVAYIVVRLQKNQKNMRFTDSYSPFSVPLRTPDDRAFEARRVSDSGAYFIVNSSKFAAGSIAGKQREMQFNIHLEIIQKKGQTEMYVPIIVDPDVGFPGGGGRN